MPVIASAFDGLDTNSDDSLSGAEMRDALRQGARCRSRHAIGLWRYSRRRPVRLRCGRRVRRVIGGFVSCQGRAISNDPPSAFSGGRGEKAGD